MHFADFARDLRVARRSLLRSPGVTAAAILSIALGAGSTIAVFAAADAALFRAPPVHDAGRLTILYIERRKPREAATRERWSWARSSMLRSASSFDHAGTFSRAVVTLTGDVPSPVEAEVVSAGYWATLQVSAERGRVFTPSDELGGGVTIVSDDLWRSRFGGDASLLGRTIAVNGQALVVVGIAPRGFSGLSGRAQIWIPPAAATRLTYAGYLTTNQNFISVVAHLRPGVSFGEARAELAILGPRIQRTVPSESDDPSTTFSASLEPLAQARIDPSTRRPLLLLLIAVSCLLVLACANVAGLLLDRAISRRREIAIRVATGATRCRIVRQLLVEAAVIALIGGALGVLLAYPLATGLVIPPAAARGGNFYGALGEFASPRIDLRVLAFALGVCAATTLAFGLVPALRATRVDLVGDLKEGTSAVPTRAGRMGARQYIVAIESALAATLLFVSALFVGSWRAMATTGVGFEPERVLAFDIRPSAVAYPPARAAQLVSRVLAEVQRVPGVVAASVDGCAPVAGRCANAPLYIVGRPQPAPDAAPIVLRHYVGPDHFRTLGVPLRRGRFFDASDRAGGERVAIINEAAARRFWPGQDPIGQRVWFDGGSSFDRPDSAAEIVGVVGDVAYQPIDEHPFQADFYTPYTQFTFAARTVLVRANGDPAGLVPDLRRAVRRADPGLAVFEPRTMDEVMADSRARNTYQTRLLAAFSALAIGLSAMGIFAIITHAIGDRRREIGVRMALGAGHGRIIAVVADHGARPAIIGAVVGLGCAIGLGRVIAAAIYGVTAFDPWIVVLVCAIVLGVIALAAYAAARRALSVRAAEALRA